MARDGDGPWRCLGVAPSYELFLQILEGSVIPWSARTISGGPPDVPRLLAAAARLLGGAPVTVVAIDMPVSRVAITGRRTADNAVSRAFGAAGCGTHSPTPARPGALGASLTTAFKCAGYPVSAAGDSVGTPDRLLEVYPHPALLRLMGEERRLAYKTGKSGTYWPGTSVRVRMGRLLAIHNRILGALGDWIRDIPLSLPTPPACPNLAALKRYEDALDALVCAWVGCRYLDGDVTAYGDDDAAIWIPNTPAAQ